MCHQCVPLRPGRRTRTVASRWSYVAVEGPIELCGRRVPDAIPASSSVLYIEKARFFECSQPVCHLGRLEDVGPVGAMPPKKKEEMSTEASKESC